LSGQSNESGGVTVCDISGQTRPRRKDGWVWKFVEVKGKMTEAEMDKWEEEGEFVCYDSAHRQILHMMT
jgi:hypothetical protein